MVPQLVYVRALFARGFVLPVRFACSFCRFVLPVRFAGSRLFDFWMFVGFFYYGCKIRACAAMGKAVRSAGSVGGECLCELGCASVSRMDHVCVCCGQFMCPLLVCSRSWHVSCLYQSSRFACVCNYSDASALCYSESCPFVTRTCTPLCMLLDMPEFHLHHKNVRLLPYSLCQRFVVCWGSWTAAVAFDTVLVIGVCCLQVVKGLRSRKIQLATLSLLTKPYKLRSFHGAIS